MAVKKSTRILSKNEDYNGITAGVQFQNGIGKTSDPWLIQWFSENGYTVEGEKEA